MFASCGKLASTLMPPVKSMAKFSPRMKNDAKQMIMSTVESVYHTLRVAMNGKLVFLWKNSTVRILLTDRQFGDLAFAAEHERQQRARAHERGEHGCEDAERQHDRESLDGAGTEHE